MADTQANKSPRELAFARLDEATKAYGLALLAEGRASGREQGLAEARAQAPALTGITLADVLKAHEGLVSIADVLKGAGAGYEPELTTLDRVARILQGVAKCLAPAPTPPPAPARGPLPNRGPEPTPITRSHEDATSHVKSTDVPNTSDAAEQAYQADVDRWLNGDGTDANKGYQVPARKRFLQDTLDTLRSGMDAPAWDDTYAVNSKGETHIWDDTRRANAVKHAERLFTKHFS